MNGRQRVRALLAGGKLDRVPVLASTLANAAWLKGMPQHAFHTDPDGLARTVVDVSREVGVDGVYVSSDNWIIHEALGGEVLFPEDDEPWGLDCPLVREWGDLKGLRVPDPQGAGRMPMMLDAARRAVERAAGELYIEANIDSGPFQLALTLCGSERVLVSVTEEPDRVREFMEFGTQVAIAYGRAMARTGVDAIQFGESSASLVGRDVYEELILPYDQRVIAALQKENVAVFLHVCGNSRHLLDSLSRSGADCLELDALVDLDDAFATVGTRTAIRGNVDTALLLEGPVSGISEAARDCIAKAHRNRGRLVLSPGCGVPKFTPLAHVRSLVAVANEASADLA
jgi:MtaA/CmuA family methyltransferase